MGVPKDRRTMGGASLEKTGAALRHVLEKCWYDEAHRVLRGEQYFIDPWPAYETVRDEIRRFPTATANALRLFLLGEAIPSSHVTKELISEGELSLLLDSGFLIIDSDDRIMTDGYAIVSFRGDYFAAGFPHFYPTCGDKQISVYIGMDSYRLARSLPHHGAATVLDLGTGSGFQAILCAREGAKVVAIEQNSKAVDIARLNVAINNLNDRVEIRRGDLYSAVPNERFDRIIMNPPFMPVPQGIPYPACGAGGEDGLVIVRRFLAGLSAHLNPHGRAYMAGQAIGSSAGPFLIQELRELQSSDKWDLLVTLDVAMPLSFQSHVIASITAATTAADRSEEDLTSAWKDLYERLGAEYLFSFELTARRAVRSPRLTILTARDEWKYDDIPIPENNLVFQETGCTYTVKRGGQRMAEIDEEALTFMQLADGNKTVSELSAEICEKYRDRYAKRGIEGALVAVLQVCRSLGQLKLLRREGNADT
ncbi:methyltransferase [Candidatus Zixiibacteriota bacterium]